MKSRKFLSALLLLAGLAISKSSSAVIVADWGTVSTPITTETSFSFVQYDVSNNFTDQYAFSLAGASGASYSVTFQFDACKNGCGNPDLSYGIYDSNGGLVAAATGTVALSAGSYVFQVKGDGMGSGNSIDYSGSVTFSAVNTSMVSPAPEPSTLMLTLFGLGGLGWEARRRRQAHDSGRHTANIVLTGAR
jgi:hypothetical protein